MSGGSSSSLVSQLLLRDDELLHAPVHLPLHFLPVLGRVAQADTGDVAQVLGRKLKPVNVSPEMGRKACLGFASAYSDHLLQLF